MNIFRKKIFKVFFAIFASFFMGAFGFGIFQFFGGNNVLTINGKDVKISQYLEIYNNLIQRLQTTTQEQSDFVKREAINSLVGFNIILQDAKKTGIAISKSELQDTIRQNSNFSYSTGEFDVDAYHNFLTQINSSASRYEKRLQEDIIYGKYLQLFSTPVQITPILEDFYKSYYQRKAQVSYTKVPDKIWKIGFHISDKKLREFYDSRARSYRKPLQYSTFLFYFPKKNIDISISDSAVNSYLSRNQEEYIEKAQYKSSHILLSLDNATSSVEIRKKIYTIYQQLVKDKTQFVKLAKKYSEDEANKEQGGDLGWVYYGDFVSEFEDVVKELEVGEVSEPFLTEFGYHIVYLEDQKDSVIDEEKAKKEIKNLLEKRRFNDYLSGVLENLVEGKDYSILNRDKQNIIDENQLIFSNAIISPEFEYEGSQLTEVYFDLQNYVEQNPNFKEIQGALVDNEDEDENSAYFGYTIIDNGAVFYQFLDTILGDKIEFEKVKGAVKDDFENLELKRIADTQSIILATKYKTKEDFQKAVKEWQSKIEVTEVFYTIPTVDDLFSSIKDRVFQSKKEQLFFLQNNKDLYGVFIDNIIQDASLDSISISFKDELEARRSEALINKYIIELAKNANIKENNTILKQYNIPLK